MSKEVIKLKYKEINEEYKRRYMEGYDLSKVKGLVDEAMQHYKKGDYENAEKLLDKAHILLNKE